MTCLCGHDALDHFDEVRFCQACDCTAYRYDVDAANQPHRVISVDLRYVVKEVYPDLAAAEAGAAEVTAKHGGLWFAAAATLIHPTPDPKLGRDPITVVTV